MKKTTQQDNMNTLLKKVEKELGLAGVNSVEDLFPRIKAAETDKQVHDLVYWYFIRNEAKRLIIPMDSEPKVPKERYIQIMVGRVKDSFIELVILCKGITLPYSRDILPKVADTIEKSYLDEWYAMYENKTVPMKSDPNWMDRCEKIAHAMWVDMGNPKSLFHKIGASHGVGTINIFNPGVTEGIQVCFFEKRSITYFTVENKKKITPVFEKSGSVSGTTLKQMREAVAKTKGLTNDRHMLAICDLLIKNI